jgi:hypothetical protein
MLRTELRDLPMLDTLLLSYKPSPRKFIFERKLRNNLLGHRLFIPIILAIWEGEIGNLTWAKVRKTPSQPLAWDCGLLLLS